MNEENKKGLEDYMRQLELALSQLPVFERSEILLELNTHLTESLEKGDKTLDELLASLGSPQDVAKKYLDEKGLKPDSYVAATASTTGSQTTGKQVFKWGCGCVLILIAIVVALIVLLTGGIIKSCSKVTEISTYGSFEGPAVKLDGKDKRIEVLGGMVELDGKNQTVKVGDIVEIDGKKELVKVGDIVDIDGQKERILIKKGKHRYRVQFSEDKLNSFTTDLATFKASSEFQLNYDKRLYLFKVNEGDPMELMGLKEGDVFTGYESEVSLFNHIKNHVENKKRFMLNIDRGDESLIFEYSSEDDD